MNINKFSPMTGRMIQEDGSVFNVADKLKSIQHTPVVMQVTQKELNSRTPFIGRMITENGEVINIADWLKNFTGGGSGGAGDYNDLLNKPTLNGVEIVGDKTSADYKISAERNKINHGTNDTTFALPPNETHIWGEVPTLTLTLKTPENENVENEYRFVFTSGATATVLSLPKDVKSDIVVEPNTIYECSIVDDRMTFNEWSVANA